MCGVGDNASYVRFGETGQIFKPIAQAYHRNEAPKSAFWFGSSDTGYIGTGALLVRTSPKFRQHDKYTFIHGYSKFLSSYNAKLS